MPIVTDKEFYLDRFIIQLLDLCLRREKKGWDNVIIIDGAERSGKSTMVRAMAYYMAWKQAEAKGEKPDFDLKNIFFDPEELMDFATKTRNQKIIWDEAALGGMSTQWQSKTTQRLKQTLMMTGKYNHTYFFIIPSFFYLDRYLSLHRSDTLVHIYTPDMESRGHFRVFNKMQKSWIYNNYRKTNTYGKTDSHRGKYTKKNTDKIIDEDAYERKKDEAILKSIKTEKENKNTRENILRRKLLKLQNRVAWLIKPRAKAAEIAGVSIGAIKEWRQRPGSLGIEPGGSIDECYSTGQGDDTK